MNHRGRGHGGRATAAFLLGFLLAGCTVVSDQSVVVSAGEISDFWDVRWNPQLGTPSLMTNRSLQDVAVSRDTPALGAAEAGSAVRAVLDANPQWFRLRPGVDDLVVSGSRASGWLRQVEMHQLYRGIPVVGAGYEARVFPNGRVGSIEGRFHPDLEMVVTPAIDAEFAVARARDLVVNGAFRPDVPVLRVDVQRYAPGDRTLVIVPAGSGLVLAWAVTVENGPNARARVCIDAATGGVIGRQLISGTWMR